MKIIKKFTEDFLGGLGEREMFLSVAPKLISRWEG